MKKIDLGQTVGIAANVGVVIGLVLVAVQINQSNEQTAAAIYQARITEIEEARTEFALSDYLPAIYAKLNERGLEDLNAEEVLRVRNWERARITRMEGQHHQYLDGFLEPDIHERAAIAAARRMGIWSQLGIEVEDPSFREAIEAILPTTEPYQFVDFRP